MSPSATSTGLNGTLATVTFPDLLQLLSSGRKTGTLTLRNAEHTKRIFFKDGEIISSSSDDPAEYLGQFLLYQGKINEDQLQKALQVQNQTGVMIGKILVMAGSLSEADLVKMLVRKAEETIFSLFLWQDGSFAFEDGELPRQEMIPISMKAQEILLEGARAVDDLQRIRKEFRSPRAILARTDRQAPANALAHPLIGRIYERLDGRLSIPDLCLEFRCSELTASRILHALMTTGYVQVVGAAATVQAAEGAASPQALMAKAEELERGGQAEASIDQFRRALALSPSDPNVRARLERAEAHFVEKAHKHLLPLNRVPTLRASLESLMKENLNPQEGFLVSRINGTWDLRSIISISPMKEVDALLCVDRLRRRGFIELKEAPDAGSADATATKEPLPPVSD